MRKRYFPEVFVFGGVMKNNGLVIGALALLLMCPCLSAAQEAQKTTVREGSALKTEDTVVGQGEEAVTGAKVVVHYSGWLNEAGKKGTKFDSSLDRGKPFSFVLGSHMVIQGWDEGVKGMKVGGKRTLYIPYSMAYGERGFPPVIPSRADLIFDVELLGVNK